jgi:ribulose-5-phosphate 4-epimerase/fuculose-1-phosphate aldolase
VIELPARVRCLLLTAVVAAAAALPLRAPAVAAAQPTDGRAALPTTIVADLVAANRILAREGVVDGYGHVSVRHPSNSDRFLMSRSVAPELVEAQDILEYGLDGEAIDPRGRASYQERFIHSEIYRARRDVNAVVHCHTPSLITFAASSVPLRAMYHQSAFVAEGVPVFEIRTVAGMTDMLVKTPPLGAALARVLGGKPAVLMRGHGAVIVGISIPHVVGRSVFLDVNARAQMQALTLGGRITYIHPDEARQRNSGGEYDRSWELWKRAVSVNR